MTSLAEIEKAAKALPLEPQQELLLFFGSRLRVKNNDGFWKLSPAERAANLRDWAASHESGPGLPDSAIGRDAIYE